MSDRAPLDPEGATLTHTIPSKPTLFVDLSELLDQRPDLAGLGLSNLIPELGAA